MDPQLLCPCGHSLALHDYGGCSGERLRSCPCGRNKRAALEAAETESSTPVYGPGYAGRMGVDAA